MPIRPENRARYPANWREISLRIRNGRAGGRCECAGECGTDHAAEVDGDYVGRAVADTPLDRCQALNGFAHPITGSAVVLTVAHLDHTPENCDDANLKAMCQACHNRYDAPVRRRGIVARLRAACALGDLFK